MLKEIVSMNYGDINQKRSKNGDIYRSYWE